ncbi:MAG: response regulator [Mariprofundaceae bacterium]
MFHVIDDMPELLEVYEGLIEHAGYRSVLFGSAESYLGYFNSSEFVAPVAILSDQKMNGMSGLELVKEIRKKIPHQKIVIITGTHCTSLNEEIDSRLCYLLTKPFKIEVFFSLLETLVNCEHLCRSDGDTSGLNLQYSSGRERAFIQTRWADKATSLAEHFSGK